MKIADAPAGTHLVDSDGDPWLRTKDGALFRPVGPEGSEFEEEDLEEADELFGPFEAVPAEHGEMER